MNTCYDSQIVRFTGRFQAPMLQLYGLYVLLHGHYSPGGGFQAGAALAASYLIIRVTEGHAEGLRGLTTRRATWLAYIGVAVYGLTGLIPMIASGVPFLDYSGLDALPLMPGGASTRAVGTVTIEIGVTMAVMGIMITLFDDLLAYRDGEAPQGSAP